ncbi:MAG TPA: glycosyltransferase family 39 protein [Anaerolineae bacterium]|nr:glycosyltransferase family 39 protein [Anaerolineae bacterium]
MGLTFVLRLWGLTATSLWYDETFMVTHAQQGVLAGVAGLWREDNAIPLHGLLLALWIQVAGSGEFAVRYLSVLLGVSAAPLVMRLGGAVSGRRGGGWGAALAYATLPIYVYYSQEVRMYALVVPLAAAFAWTAWRLRGRGRGAAAYVILGAAMLLAHLYAGLLWAAVLAWGMVRGRQGEGERGRQGEGEQGGRGAEATTDYGLRTTDYASRFTFHVSRSPFWRANLWLGLAALPIAAWAIWRAGVDATAVSAIPTSTVKWLPVLFGVGQYLPAPWTAVFVGVTGLSLVLAFVGLIRARRFVGIVWLLITLCLPVLLLLASTFVKAKWSERYLLPSFGLALAVGVGTGWERGRVGEWERGRGGDKETRRQGDGESTPHVSRFTPYSLLLTPYSLLLVSWLALMFPALSRQAAGTWAVGVVDEWHPRPDFRGVARYIAEHDAPGDAVVVVGGYAAHTLSYYYDRPARVFGLPFDTRLLDTGAALDLRALSILERESQGTTRLWLVLWQANLADPTDLIQSVLVDQCDRLGVGGRFTNVSLLLFDVTSCRPLDRLVSPPLPLDAAFVAPIRLAGYNLIRNGEAWEVDVWWETSGALAEDYAVFVHLLDADGTLVAQHDHIAGADAYPTHLWPPGTRLRDRFFLAVPGGRCEGCQLHVGLYTSQARLSLRDGSDSVEIVVEGE